MSACLKFVQNVSRAKHLTSAPFIALCWKATLSKGGHDRNVLSNLDLIHARPGQLKTLLTVEKRHLNNHKTIHGGVLLSLTDTVTSLTLSTMGIPPPTGVSVNVSCEFVRPGGVEGDKLLAIGEVSKLGRTLAFTRVAFYTEKEQLVAFGSHTKHMGNNVAIVKFSSDGESEIA